MSDIPSHHPLSTRDTTVKCCVCHNYEKIDKAIYGISPYKPLMLPNHFCPRCAEVYRVVDWSPLDEGERK